VDKVYRDIILGHGPLGLDQYEMNPSDKYLCGGMEKYALWIDFQIALHDQVDKSTVFESVRGS
jgi:hypothetical protein